MIFCDWVQCFEFSSVLQHWLLDNRTGIPVKKIDSD